MGPFFLDALAVVHREVEPGIAGTDFPCEIDFGADALPYDIRMAVQHGHFGRAFKMPPIGHGIGAAGEDPPVKAFFRGGNQGLAHFRAQGITHHEQIATVQHNILAH